MRKADAQRFAQLMAVLASAFRQEADQAMLEGYSIGLGDVPIESIELAVHKAIRTCKFFPSVSELRQLAGEMPPDVRAIKAWDAFCGGVKHRGYYVSVDFDDPVINATVRNLGGWMPLLDRIEEEGDVWVRKEFERIYAAMLSGGVSASEAGPLLGFHEQSNRQNGYTEAIKKPTKVITGLPPHRAGVLAAPMPANETKVLPSDTKLLEGIGRPIERP